MLKSRTLFVVWVALTALLPSPLMAQDDWRVEHGDCMPVPADMPLQTGVKKLPATNTNWDASRTYKQLVILINFVDEEFYRENPKTDYEKMFNETGYNEGLGLGCVADYFRDQSGGLLNLSFDVYGPFSVSQKSQPYDSPTKDTRNYGRESFVEATNKLIEEHPEIDFSQYDWNGDGNVNQVVYVYAGVSGNLGSKTYGHIWPNTSSFSTITTPDGLKISNYTASGETLPTTTPRSSGIGTICHEFSHSLGLPDIYPTAGSQGYSVCDEWDLMDGGNFTNYGWCPPNFTALEKYLLGWVELTELDEAASITDLKPSADGGEIYRIKHSDSEWLLLENRQQKDWDLGAPGYGLVIYHINYDGTVWRGNSVNNDMTKRRFHLVHADNRDYDAWKEYISANGLSTYANSNRMNNRHLSTSPYPYVVDEEVCNDALTDTSTPPATMFYPNLDSDILLGKPITNIRMNSEGLISFDFMGAVGINAPHSTLNAQPAVIYDLQGRRLETPVHGNIYIMKHPDGTVSKRIYRNE